MVVKHRLPRPVDVLVQGLHRGILSHHLRLCAAKRVGSRKVEQSANNVRRTDK